MNCDTKYKLYFDDYFLGDFTRLCDIGTYLYEKHPGSLPSPKTENILYSIKVNKFQPFRITELIKSKDGVYERPYTAKRADLKYRLFVNDIDINGNNWHDAGEYKNLFGILKVVQNDIYPDMSAGALRSLLCYNHGKKKYDCIRITYVDPEDRIKYNAKNFTVEELNNEPTHNIGRRPRELQNRYILLKVLDNEELEEVGRYRSYNEIKDRCSLLYGDITRNDIMNMYHNADRGHKKYPIYRIKKIEKI